MIARCVDAADVIAAVKFGRVSKLPIAVRGGGHNGPGLGSVDDGLVIDLSAMRGTRVDPAKRVVRVGPGCVTGEVDHATHAFGQATPFGVAFLTENELRFVSERIRPAGVSTSVSGVSSATDQALPQGPS